MKKKFFLKIFCVFYLIYMMIIIISGEVQNKDRPKVSIIVPVYNTEKWLPECMNSLINQTLEEIEIICVDDGSTDNSRKIIEEYVKKDEEILKSKKNKKDIKGRIKVIHQNHQGVSAARNAGLDIASGEYITFVDSDDYVHPECYKTAYFWAINDNIDIIQYGLNRIRNEEQKKIKDKSKINKSDSNVLNLEQFLKKSKREYVCFKMIKSNIIKDNNIRFRTDIIISEDACFSFMVFPRAKRFKIIPGKFYNYRARPGSAVANWDHKDYANRQVKIIITQVYYNWKEGGLIKGREHILLEFIFHVAGANTISRFGEILKIIDELNSPEVLSKCSEKCKGEIIKLKK